MPYFGYDFLHKFKGNTFSLYKFAHHRNVSTKLDSMFNQNIREAMPCQENILKNTVSEHFDNRYKKILIN